MKVRFVKASAVKGLTEAQRDAFTYSLKSAGVFPVITNEVYIPHYNRPERIQILYGGSGSGKSDWKATELLLKCLLNPYCRVMYVRKVYDSIRATQFQLFKDVIKRYGLDDYFKVREDGMVITSLQNGNFLFAKGLDDIDKVKSIADVTDIWIEEPIDKKGTISSSDFTELSRRLRCAKAPNHMHFTFNPISKESWIYDYFFRSDSYQPFVLKTTYLDNAFSTDGQIWDFERLKEKKYDEWLVYALGEWGTLKQGLVIPEYKIIQDFPTGCRRDGYGLDWGFNPDPTAVVRCGLKDGGLYLDEVLYQNNLISTTRAEAMRRAGVQRNATIVADRNPEAIEELKRLGFPLIQAADKGPGSIKAGIDIMKGFDIYVTEQSKNLIMELNNYEWATDRRTGGMTGEPIDAYNHAIDAARYWVQKTVAAPVAQQRKVRTSGFDG